MGGKYLLPRATKGLFAVDDPILVVAAGRQNAANLK
jgi:hypothetical protein